MKAVIAVERCGRGKNKTLFLRLTPPVVCFLGLPTLHPHPTAPHPLSTMPRRPPTPPPPPLQTAADINTTPSADLDALDAYTLNVDALKALLVRMQARTAALVKAREELEAAAERRRAVGAAPESQPSVSSPDETDAVSVGSPEHVEERASGWRRVCMWTKEELLAAQGLPRPGVATRSDEEE